MISPSRRAIQAGRLDRQVTAACPHNLTWFRGSDGDLIATKTVSANYQALSLRECTELFGVDSEEQQTIPCNYKSWLQRRADKLQEGQFQSLFSNDSGVCKLLAVLEDFGSFERNTHQIIYIQEFSNGGDLITHLQHYCNLSNSPGLHIEDIRHISRQLIATLSRLHSQGVAHCDIKLDNILCNFKQQPTLKLTDWGLASRPLNQMTTKRVGTFGYWAPELFEDGRDSTAPYNAFTAEAWSLGVTLYTLYAGHPPFGRTPWTCGRFQKFQMEQENGITNHSWLIPSFWANDFTDLIQQLLTVDVQQRGTIIDLNDHIFLVQEELTSDEEEEEEEEYENENEQDVLSGEEDVVEVVEVVEEEEEEEATEEAKILFSEKLLANIRNCSLTLLDSSPMTVETLEFRSFTINNNNNDNNNNDNNNNNNNNNNRVNENNQENVIQTLVWPQNKKIESIENTCILPLDEGFSNLEEKGNYFQDMHSHLHSAFLV